MAHLWLMQVPDGQGEYVSFVEDLMRMSTIQVTMQLLMVFQGVATLGMDFLVYLLQVMVGVAAYWLVVRRAVGVARPNGAVSPAAAGYTRAG